MHPYFSLAKNRVAVVAAAQRRRLVVVPGTIRMPAARIIVASGRWGRVAVADENYKKTF